MLQHRPGKWPSWEMFATQARGPEFRPEHPHKKPGTVTCACSVLLEVGEIGGSLGLASQLV